MGRRAKASLRYTHVWTATDVTDDGAILELPTERRDQRSSYPLLCSSAVRPPLFISLELEKKRQWVGERASAPPFAEMLTHFT